MANIDAAYGFIPVNRDGSPWSGTARVFDVAAGYAAALGIGSFVTQVADGSVEASAAGATEVILGAVIGVVPYPTGDFGESGSHANLDLQKLYSPASTAGKVLVAVADENTYFMAQEDADTSYLVALDRGARANVIGTGVSTTTGRSTIEIDSSSDGQDATYQLILVDKVNKPDNAYSTGVAGVALPDVSNADWIVKVNLTQHGRATAGI